MLPFLQMKLDIDHIAFECESIVSSNKTKNETYKYGLEKVDEYLNSNNMQKMIDETFTNEDKIKVE